MSRAYDNIFTFGVLVLLLFSMAIRAYSCVELKGITGPNWKIVKKGQAIDLGPVGRGSYLNFIIDVQERQRCPPWDNWDKAWVEGLPSKGFKQLNTSWFQIYFAPFTILVLKDAKLGNYTTKFCVEDQGTKIVECHRLRFRVEKPKLSFDINITKGFNAFTIGVRETGNLWIYCVAEIKGKNTKIEKRFYAIPNKTLYIPFAPKEDGKYYVEVHCPGYKYYKNVSFTFKKVLFEISKKNITVKPGDKVTINILSYPYVNFSFSSDIPLYNTTLTYNEFSFQVPRSVFPGRYNVTICASYNGKKQCDKILLNVYINWSLICPFIHIEALNQTVVLHNLTPFQLYFKISNDDTVAHELPITIYYNKSILLLKYPDKVLVPKKGYYILKVLIIPQKFINTSLRLAVKPCRKIIGVNIYIYKKVKKVFPLAEISQPEVMVNPSFFEVYPSTKSVTVSLYINNNNNIVNNTTCLCKIPEAQLKFMVFRDYLTSLKINLINYQTPGVYNYTIPVICRCGNKTYRIIKTVKIKIKSVSTLVVNPMSIIITNQKGTKKLTIENIGNSPTTVSLFSTCPIRLSTYNFNIKPGEKKIIELTYSFKHPITTNCYILINNKIKVPVAIIHRAISRPLYHRTSKNQNNTTLSRPFMPIFLSFDLLFSKIF